MLFFDREKEIGKLKGIRELSNESAQFTILQGRRRIGKTELLLQAFSDKPFIYLFVSHTSEIELCSGFKERIEAYTGNSIPGKITRFSELFRYLMEYSKEHSITVLIDEFQDFFRINPSTYSEMQRDWDELHRNSKINLVVSGSIHTLMNKIFMDSKEPLYGRQTGQIHLHAFPISVLKEILGHYYPKYNNDDLLALWTFTGGIAKYVALLMDQKAFTKDKMIDVIFEEDSFFLNEGWSILNEEFGRESGTYFSILSAIAHGKTSRGEISNEVGGELSGYMTRLESQYDLIVKKQPFDEPTSNKRCIYKIHDSFFRFWFRFIYKYQYLIELRMFEELRSIVRRDYEVFSGLSLEEYFRQKFIEEHHYTRIEGWWDRKGDNEIDLICDNELNNTLDFYEIKREGQRISLERLKDKSGFFFTKHPQYSSRNINYHGISLKDM